jgi:hypothetical protein
MFGITGDEINPSKLVKPSHFSPNNLLSRFIQADPSVDAEEEIDVERSKNRVDLSREGKSLVY